MEKRFQATSKKETCAWRDELPPCLLLVWLGTDAEAKPLSRGRNRCTVCFISLEGLVPDGSAAAAASAPGDSCGTDSNSRAGGPSWWLKPLGRHLCSRERNCSDVRTCMGGCRLNLTFQSKFEAGKVLRFVGGNGVLEESVRTSSRWL